MNMGKFSGIGFTCSKMYDVLDFGLINKHGKFQSFNSANVRQFILHSCHNYWINVQSPKSSYGFKICACL